MDSSIKKIENQPRVDETADTYLLYSELIEQANQAAEDVGLLLTAAGAQGCSAVELTAFASAELAVARDAIDSVPPRATGVADLRKLLKDLRMRVAVLRSQTRSSR